MRRTEEQFNTKEQVLGYLQEALDIVDTLAPPNDLWEACFTKAADLLSAKQIFFDQPQQVPIDPRFLRPA